MNRLEQLEHSFGIRPGESDQRAA